MIEGVALTVAVRGRLLLHDVSVVVSPGEVVAVVGPNGAGKSTLLRVLAGTLTPVSGQVLVQGRPLAAWSPRALAKVRAVLPQEVSVSFPLTALEVVVLGRSPHVDGQEGPVDFAIARAAMAATNTLALEDRAYPTLSGGERQRVQLARVLAQIWQGPGPRILMLDEPTSNLDLPHQHALLVQARRTADDGVAVLCVLHDLNLAAQYADRIVVVQNGTVVASGPPRRVLDRALLHDVFQVDGHVLDHPTLPCPLVIVQGGGMQP